MQLVYKTYAYSLSMKEYFLSQVYEKRATTNNSSDSDIRVGLSPYAASISTYAYSLDLSIR